MTYQCADKSVLCINGYVLKLHFEIFDFKALPIEEI